jgi:CheY-like chemotaxis protein
MRFVTQVQEKPDTQTLQGKRILIVEDYPLMGEILSDALSVYGHASHVLTGRDALEQIEHKAPDVILLDLNLPDMNGLEVVKFVRRNEKTSRIPVLAMSGTVMNHRARMQRFYPQAIQFTCFAGSIVRADSWPDLNSINSTRALT